MRASKLDPIVSVQDVSVQLQALFNIRDSNKVCLLTEIIYIVPVFFVPYIFFAF